MENQMGPALGESVQLKRGGYVFNTSAGYVQVGVPPETIKDTMTFEQGVPSYFCLPRRYFHKEKGISVAEIEFPIYFNFFIKKKKTVFICLEEHRKRFEGIVKESLFGPEEINLQYDYSEDYAYEIPNLKAEIDYFAGAKLDDMVEFKTLDKVHHSTMIEGVQITLNKDSNFLITDKKIKKQFLVPGNVRYHVLHDLGSVQAEPFKPPAFGMTCLGPSHGFDPLDNTSGFILWVNGHGIMIDPPVNSTEWLRESNVNPKLIDSVILTHTHADHDAGTFQKILLDTKITIYTTQTIMGSWLDKYSRITGMPKKDILALFNFLPIKIGESLNIHGAWFSFNYRLHSVPTIGFRTYYKDRSMVYTSDHLNSPDIFQKLLDENVISKSRYDELMDFPWESDIIYHEAGVPPLHTPIDYLASLPEDLRKKTTVYHIARKDVPDVKYLKRAEFGIANTISEDIPRSAYEEAYWVIDALTRIDLFEHFSIGQTKELLSVITKETITKGSQIVKRGEIGKSFYIIICGTCYLSNDRKEIVKRFGAYQYFGEVSLLMGTPRTADIYAETDVDVLKLSRAAFINLIRGTVIEKRLKYIALNRDEESWATLAASTMFPLLTNTQKTDLEMLLEHKEIEEDSQVVISGKKCDYLYLFGSGVGICSNPQNGASAELKKGDFLGDYKAICQGKPSSLDCSVTKGSTVFRIKTEVFLKFLKSNPGVYLRFLHED